MTLYLPTAIVSATCDLFQNVTVFHNCIFFFTIATIHLRLYLKTAIYFSQYDFISQNGILFLIIATLSQNCNLFLLIVT